MTKIRNYLERCVEEKVFPGVSWAVGNCSGVLDTGCAGVLGNGLPPVREDSLYDLASLTKIFTALSLMKQFEEGRVRLEDRLDYFLPLAAGRPIGEATILMLMTHTAPLPGITQYYRYAKTREDLLRAICYSPPRSDSPGKVVYTCDAFILLGEVVSVIDGAGLDEVVRRRVLEPLGMKDTCYKPGAELLPRIAPTEDCPWRGKIVRGQVHDENAVVLGEVGGNAGIFSTITDMSRLAAALLASVTGGAFLHKAAAEMMTRNYTPGAGENRGLCWSVAGPASSAGDLFSPRSFGHTGFTGTSLWVDPERELFAVLLSNRIHPRRDNEGIFRTRHIFHNLAVLEYGESGPSLRKE